MTRFVITRRAVIACVIGSALVVGLAPSTHAAPVLEPFDVEAVGMTVGIPGGWEAFDLTDTKQPAIQKALDKAGAKDPEGLTAIVPTLLQQGGVLYAIAPKRRGGINENLGLLRGPVLDRTLEDFDRDLRAPFKNVKAKVPKINPVQVDGVDGRQISGNVKVGDSKVLLRQVIVVVNKSYLALTLSLKSGTAGKELADGVVESIAFDD